MSKTSMNTNVIASTSGIDTATTSPVRRPRLTSDTARTIVTASASERRNSRTERATARGMLATCPISTPAGSRASTWHELRVERAAEIDHVAALHHRDADAERLAPVPAHLLLRRVDVAARYVGDVAQPEEAVVRADRDVAHRVQRVERAGGPQIDAVGRRLEHAGRGDRVLRAERLHDLRRLDAEQREPCVRHLDVDLLVLLADEIDLGHAGDAQQLRADAIAEFLQVAVAEAVAGDRVDVGVRVAELVVEKRPLDARGQRVADVADLLAHLVLQVGNRRPTAANP